MAIGDGARQGHAVGAGIAAGVRFFKRRSCRGTLCALVGAGLWGLSGVGVQFLLASYDVSPLLVTTIRMLSAGVLFVGVLAARQPERLKAMVSDRRTLGQLLTFGVGGLYLCQVTYATVVDYTNAGTATVLQCTGIAFVMLLSFLAGHHVPRMREVIGLVAAMVATWLIATQGNPAALSLPLPGLLWGMANGLSVAFYTAYPKGLFARWGSFAATGVGMLVGGLVAAVTWVATAAVGITPLVAPTFDAIGVTVLCLVTLVGTFAAFSLYLYGVSVVGPVKGSLLGAVEPVSATLFSTLLLGTTFTGPDWAGLALMIAMMFLVTTGGRQSEEKGRADEGDV